jgi:hypothetical protein
MTETTFPFSSVEPTPATPEDSGDHRRLAAFLGSGLLALALAGAAVFAFGGGDDVAADPTLSSVTGTPRVVTPPVAPAEAQAVPVANTETFARNPFEAKYIAPPPPPTPAPLPVAPLVPVDQSLDLVPLPLDLGGIGDAPSGPLITPSPAAQAASPAPAAEYPLTLDAVSDPQPEVRLISWTVDGEKVQVIPGQRFGRFGELVVLAYSLEGAEGGADGVVLQVGDASPVVVTVGETISVL